MNLLSLFSIAVFAAETILSPLPDEQPFTTQNISTPTMTFAKLSLPDVLGLSTDEPPSPTPTPPIRRAKKSHYTIALLGDSMIDTLGPDAPHVKARLQSLYPGVTFDIVNFGVGGENIDNGIVRLTNETDYLGRHRPSLLATKPDVVVVESFGYNPFIDPTSELDRHWLALAKIVDILKSSLPGVRIVIASTIAPNATIFGDGVLNWNPTEKQEKVVRIKSYLDNAIKFAKSERLPVADAYHPSIDGSGNGKETYINPGDHIHYADAGRELFARAVTAAITTNKLLE